MKAILQCIFILLLIDVRSLGAQNTSNPEYQVLAEITEPRSLALDRGGLIYVVTASKILQLDPQGTVLSHLDGTNLGVFGDLSDIAPGTGLIWVIADADHGSLYRFTKELLHLETIRVPRNAQTEVGRSPRVEFPDQRTTLLGQPISVSVGVSGELFAIDASSQSVLKWDGSRRLERTIGAFGSGAGQLINPSKTATDATLVYVADQSLNEIKVYDYFGGYVMSIQTKQEVKSITTADDQLWVVFENGIKVYSDQGRLDQELNVQLNDPLIGAEPFEDQLYLLTDKNVLRMIR